MAASQKSKIKSEATQAAEAYNKAVYQGTEHFGIVSADEFARRWLSSNSLPRMKGQYACRDKDEVRWMQYYWAAIEIPDGEL